MDVELIPEPPAGEREAVERALAALAEEGEGGRSAWWRAGAREALSPEEEPA